jgi:hypothetical protein
MRSKTLAIEEQMDTNRLPDDLNPAIVEATADFIGKITGLVPPPTDAFPPEWFGYLRTFTKRVFEIAGMNTEPVAPAAIAPSGKRKGDAARLDWLIEKQAWIRWTTRDGSTRQCQVYDQDEDENYHVLSGDDRYFNTPREAIDAARNAEIVRTRCKRGVGCDTLGECFATHHGNQGECRGQPTGDGKGD